MVKLLKHCQTLHALSYFICIIKLHMHCQTLYALSNFIYTKDKMIDKMTLLGPSMPLFNALSDLRTDL